MSSNHLYFPIAIPRDIIRKTEYNTVEINSVEIEYIARLKSRS